MFAEFSVLFLASVSAFAAPTTVGTDDGAMRAIESARSSVEMPQGYGRRPLDQARLRVARRAAQKRLAAQRVAQQRLAAQRAAQQRLAAQRAAQQRTARTSRTSRTLQTRRVVGSSSNRSSRGVATHRVQGIGSSRGVVQGKPALVVTWRNSRGKWEAWGPTQRLWGSEKSEAVALKSVYSKYRCPQGPRYLGVHGKYRVYSVGYPVSGGDIDVRRKLGIKAY